MKKMPTIFNRNHNPCRVFNMQHPDCDWVFNGEGVATRKWDGTCCMIDGGEYFKRRCVKKGKPIPDEFDEESFDENTGKAFGWVPVTEDDKWHQEAFWPGMADGTYELVGPKVQGNVEKFATHALIKHKRGHEYFGVLRTFDGIRDFMKDKDIEGIVFHHPDGRMAKIKKSDYGMERRIGCNGEYEITKSPELKDKYGYMYEHFKITKVLEREMDYHCFTFLNAISLMEDIIKISQLQTQDDCLKKNEALGMVDEIHNGKYGSWEALWTQVEIAIATIKRESNK